MARVWPLVAVATTGVILGTLTGERLLRRLPEAFFRRAVAALLLLLGGAMFFQAGR